jgi:hypothetical protein
MKLILMMSSMDELHIGLLLFESPSMHLPGRFCATILVSLYQLMNLIAILGK